MAYSDTSVVIHLINDIDAGKGDDVIRIRKNYETNEFDISYSDQNNGDSVTHNATGLYRARVLDYLYTVFKNQALDEDGYKNVQLTLPAMPRIIVSGDKFKDVYYRNHFYELIGFGLDSLETTTSVKKVEDLRRARQLTQLMNSYSTPSSNVRQHLFFDE